MASSTFTFTGEWKLAASADDGEDVSVSCYAPDTTLHWWVTDTAAAPDVSKTAARPAYQFIDMTLKAGQHLHVQTSSGQRVEGSVTTDNEGAGS